MVLTIKMGIPIKGCIHQLTGNQISLKHIIEKVKWMVKYVTSFTTFTSSFLSSLLSIRISSKNINMWQCNTMKQILSKIDILLVQLCVKVKVLLKYTQKNK